MRKQREQRGVPERAQKGSLILGFLMLDGPASSLPSFAKASAVDKGMAEGIEDREFELFSGGTPLLHELELSVYSFTVLWRPSFSMSS